MPLPGASCKTPNRGVSRISGSRYSKNAVVMWTSGVILIPDMSLLELTDDQVISLVRQLPSRSKRAALLALAEEAKVRRDERMRFAEQQLRRASAERGLDWDRLSEDEREQFVNRLLHEG